MARRRSTKPEKLSPLLVRLIEAAEQRGNDAGGRDIKGAAQALREFGSMALWVPPIYGVFVPNDEDVSSMIERVARRHLGLEEARAELRQALDRIEAFDHRDPIESACGRVQCATEEAYFYAGLAFGLTLLNGGTH